MTAPLPVIQSLITLMRSKGWQVYTRPFEINMLGMRSPNLRSNVFDDVFFVFWQDDAGNWLFRKYACTTDPGTFWLKNPIAPKGTAFLKEGQYVAAYQLGLHQGKYQALVQKEPVAIVRGLERGSGIDWNGGQVSIGFFGINIHMAQRVGKAYKVDNHSAGCQVLQSPEDYGELMELAKIHASRYGNVFTYGLIDYRTLRKSLNLRVSLMILVVGSLLALLGINWFKRKTDSSIDGLPKRKPKHMKAKVSKRNWKRHETTRSSI